MAYLRGLRLSTSHHRFRRPGSLADPQPSVDARPQTGFEGVVRQQVDLGHLDALARDGTPDVVHRADRRWIPLRHPLATAPRDRAAGGDGVADLAAIPGP